MLDKDNLTYGPNKRIGAFSDSRLSERALLTTDRSQKLDLLIHLLTNLQQSLIVCGPEGIGKTTLIKTLQDSHKEAWPICLLQGSPASSFESIITELSQFLNLCSATIRFDLSSLRAYCEKQKAVLIIDDAGELVPGLIGELIDFADSLPGLRLVFAMNYDEYQNKGDSDQAIEACHFIELPPLSQRQCLEYLQNLSVQPGTMLSFNAINDTLVEELYRKTEGIPGKLLAELPLVGKYQSRQNRKAGLWLSTGLILIAGGFVAKNWLPSSTDEVPPTKISEPVKTAASPSPQSEEIASPAPAIELATKPSLTGDMLNETSPLIAPQSPQTITGSLESDQYLVTKSLSESELNTTPEDIERIAEPEQATTPPVTPPQKSEKTIAAPETDSKTIQSSKTKSLEEEPRSPSQKLTEPAASEPKTEPDNSDLKWIMAQPTTNYTVQLMVLSYKSSVDRFIRKYADYRDSLKYYTIGKSGGEKYVLIYGSFQSATDALKRKSTMPTEFNQGIVKRFKTIQQQSRRRK